jgi:acyl-CoA thioesterase FadM
MLKLFARSLPMLMRANRQPLVPATEAVATRFQVLPHDIDINRHLNNGRYLQLIDVNRAEWLIRTGMLEVIQRNRWKPILGSLAMNYRRELCLWERATVETRLVGWDQRWTYLEHRVTNEKSDRPVAFGIAKAGFRSQGRWVDPEILRLQLPFPLSSMVLPGHAQALLAFDKEADTCHQRKQGEMVGSYT